LVAIARLVAVTAVERVGVGVDAGAVAILCSVRARIGAHAVGAQVAALIAERAAVARISLEVHAPAALRCRQPWPTHALTADAVLVGLALVVDRAAVIWVARDVTACAAIGDEWWRARALT
jgi:hypothetical protein